MRFEQPEMKILIEIVEEVMLLESVPGDEMSDLFEQV